MLLMDMRRKLRFSSRELIIIGIITLSVLVLFFIPPIPQPLQSHLFADQRFILGIPYALNVLSNIAFFIPGLIGLGLIAANTHPQAFIYPMEKLAFLAVFIGAILASLGSGYYHLQPDNQTLLWDRIPLTIIQGGILSIVLADRISTRVGVYALVPIIMLGIISVLYWEHTEMLGQGDLRFYAWSEGMPVVIVGALLLLFPSRYTGTRYLIELFILYFMGRTCELFDHSLYQLTGHFVSGHTLKHLMMGVALYSLVRYLHYRLPRSA